MIQSTFKILLFCTLPLLFVSCNDDNGDTDNSSSTTDYFPSTLGSQWVYDYTLNNQGQETSGSNTVNILEPVSVEGTSYQVMNNTFYLIGTMDQLYFNKINQDVVIRPAFNLMDNQLSFDEILLIKANATSGELISESSIENVGETLPIPPNEYNASGTVTPIIYLTLKNYKLNSSAQETVNGLNYTNVSNQQLTYEINVVLAIDAEVEFAGTSLPIVQNHELIEPQQFGELNLWFAKDVGTIKSQFNYSLEDVSLNSSLNIAGISIDLLELAPDIIDLTNSLNLSGTSLLTDYTVN